MNIKNKLEDWKYWLADHKAVLWSGIGLLLVLVLLPTTVYLVQQRQTLESEANWEGFWEGILICAYPVPGWCGTSVTLDERNYAIDSTVRISGNIYRDSGDDQSNEDLGIYIDDQLIFSSHDQPGIPPESVESFGPIEITIPSGNHKIIARHLDTSANPSSPGSVGIDLELKVVDYSMQCSQLKLYDLQWGDADLENVFVGETYYVAVSGDTTDPKGITKARFSFDDSDTWTETTNQNANGEYYVTWTAVDENPVNFQAQIYNENLGWK